MYRIDILWSTVHQQYGWTIWPRCVW